MRAIIIPIPKKQGNILKIEELRPISLTSVIGKLMERIIMKKLNTVAEENLWIPEFQKGFRKGTSTLDKLVTIQQEIHGAFKRKQYILLSKMLRPPLYFS